MPSFLSAMVSILLCENLSIQLCQNLSMQNYRLHPEVKAISKFISEKAGGKGAVRDLIEQTMKIQGKWMTAEAYSW